LIEELGQLKLSQLSSEQLWELLERLQIALKSVTYFNILAPLGQAVRQALFKIPLEQLDSGKAPEIQALNQLKALAQAAGDLSSTDPDQQLADIIQRYGYLSEVNTDIASLTWRETPQTVRNLFETLRRVPLQPPAIGPLKSRWQQRIVQRHTELKGQVATRYNQLFAQVRWIFLELEARLIRQGVLHEVGDIFYLTYGELRSQLPDAVIEVIQTRRAELAHWQAAVVPSVVYGNIPEPPAPTAPGTKRLKGIPASRGLVEGQIQRVPDLSNTPILPNRILVVPYTDAAWVTVLVQAKGIIAQVGGQLSHGAVIAREYGIPAVMNVDQALFLLPEGQWVRLDGQRGPVEILER
jgi:pyruvate,water dikinase